MSDFFGISQALRAGMNIYFAGARNTGRTVSLLNSLEDGDRVVFCDEKTARHTERMAKERGIKLEYMIADPKDPSRLFERGTSQGRTTFDHSWVEQYFKDSLEHSTKRISNMQDQLSGYGEPHIQTKLKAREVQKYREWLYD